MRTLRSRFVRPEKFCGYRYSVFTEIRCLQESSNELAKLETSIESARQAQNNLMMTLFQVCFFNFLFLQLFFFEFRNRSH
jgi:hypothetical protein